MDFLCSWIVPGKESFREDLHLFVSFVFAQNSVLLVQTLPALGFGTLRVGVVNGVSELMAEQHLNSWGVPGGRPCICNKLQVESLLSFSLSYSTPFN